MTNAAGVDPTDLVDGDMESPDWIVRNVIIDMAGFYIRDWATSAVIDTARKTYSITVSEEFEPEYNGGVPYVLTYQQIWAAANTMARTKKSEVKLRDDIMASIRVAVFEKDGGDIDAEVASCILQFAMWGKVIFD